MSEDIISETLKIHTLFFSIVPNEMLNFNKSDRLQHKMILQRKNIIFTSPNLTKILIFMRIPSLTQFI